MLATTQQRIPAITLLALMALMALMALSLLLTASAEAQTVRVPISVRGREMHSVGFANLVVRGEMTEKIGIADASYVLVLLDSLRSHGYPALGGENLVFGNSDTPAPNYMLGGTLTELVCKGRFKRTCGIAVTWELLNPKSNKVIYKVDTRSEEAGLPAALSSKIGERLLIGALKSLMSRKKFVAALSKPDDADKASDGSAEDTLPSATFKACTAAALTMPSQAENALKATVVVKSGDSIGSGVLISEEGLVLTAAHVIQDGELRVTLRDGTERDARVVRTNHKHDVALLQVWGGATPCLGLNTTGASIGSEVYAIGSPGGETLSFSLSRGIVSGQREFEGTRYLQTDASINPGNSGGPLVDSEGRVCAVISWKVAGKNFEGLGFGVPVSSAMSALRLTPGTQTDSTLHQRVKVELDKKEVKTIVDFADAPWSLAALNVKKAPPRARKPGWVYLLRFGGVGLAAAGAATAGLSYASYDDEADTKESFESARLLNDIGWIAAGVGVAAFTVSFFVGAPDETPDKKPKGVTEVTAGLGLDGFRVSGKF